VLLTGNYHVAIAKKKKKVSKKKSAGIVIPKTKKKSKSKKKKAKVTWQTKTKAKTKSKKNKSKKTTQKLDGSLFVPGCSANPAGRPKGSKSRYSIKHLMDAIADVEKIQGKQLLQVFVGKAYEDKAVMIALMKKLLPDLKSIDTLMATFETAMDDELAIKIKEELRARYE